MEKIKGNSLLFCGSGNSGTGMMTGRVLRHLERISAYQCAFDLLEDNAVLPDNKHFLRFLRHVDDWENYQYFCLNGEIVVLCDSVNGDVLSFDTVEDFLNKTREAWLSADD